MSYGHYTRPYNTIERKNSHEGNYAYGYGGEYGTGHDTVSYGGDYGGGHGYEEKKKYTGGDGHGHEEAKTEDDGHGHGKKITKFKTYAPTKTKEKKSHYNPYSYGNYGGGGGGYHKTTTYH